MTDATPHYAELILLTGVVVAVAVLIQSALERSALPPLVGFLAFSLGLRLLSEHMTMPSEWPDILLFFSKIGLVTLLFRIGLESDLAALFRELGPAAKVGLVNVLGSLAVGFATCYWLLSLHLAASLAVGVAFAATSVGVSVSLWRDAGALRSPNGALLVDVAELDDMAAIFLMALLFSLLPVAELGQGAGSLITSICATTGMFLVQFMAFAAACFFFSKYLADPLTNFLTTHERTPHPVLIVSGLGMVIASLAGMLGFSLAIGAFLGGLAFSRESGSLDIQHGFVPLYELFSPFFFIGVGYELDPAVLFSAVGLGLLFFVMSVLAKVVTTGVPACLLRGPAAGLLIGVSVVPRAEITLVAAHKSAQISKHVTPDIYAALVFTSAATCLVAAMAVRSLLQRWPQQEAT